MKLGNFGDMPDRNWFIRLYQMTINRISFNDNIDGKFARFYLKTTETEVQHTLGKVPTHIFEVASFPDGTAGISFTKAPTIDRLYLTRTVEGYCTLFLT